MAVENGTFVEGNLGKKTKKPRKKQGNFLLKIRNNSLDQSVISLSADRKKRTVDRHLTVNLLGKKKLKKNLGVNFFCLISKTFFYIFFSFFPEILLVNTSCQHKFLNKN